MRFFFLWHVVLCACLTSTALAAPAPTVGELLGEAIEDINFQSFDMAEEKLTQVLKVEPENPYAKYYMASLLSQTKRPNEAIPYLESIRDNAQLFPDYNTLLASVYMAAGMPEKALPIYKHILEQDMFEPANIFQYANALEQSGNIDAALAHYHLLTRKPTPYTDAARFQIAGIYMQFNANHKAYAELEHIDKNSAYANAAQSYQDSLQAALRPLSLYISAEYFYNDNPGSASSTYAKGAVPQAAAKGSAGATIIAALSSTAWEISHQLQTKFAYTYYTTLYNESFAKSNEFTGHFINPSITYAFSPLWSLETKLDYQVLNLGEYNLANNYGGTLTLNYNSQDRLSSAHASVNYTRKRHNQHFGAQGATVDMQYLDANSPTLGVGGYIVYSEYNAVLSVDYTLLWERTLTNTNAILNEKAKDSEYREHRISLQHHLPFTGNYQDLSMDASLSYAYRNYLNPQSGTSLPSIKPGYYFTVQTKQAGLKLQYNIGSRYNLNATFGYDWSQATSQAIELSYTQSRYYGQLSGSY